MAKELSGHQKLLQFGVLPEKPHLVEVSEQGNA